MDRTHHIFIWFSIKYSLQFLSPSPQRKTENKQKIPPRLFPPVTDYYPYSVQLNQKEIKERVNCHMSVFQIPQILGILTLFKNSEINILLPINKKVHCVETSHPSSAGDPGLSREQSPSCRHVRSTDRVGRAHRSVFCSEGNKTAEVLAHLFRSKNRSSRLRCLVPDVPQGRSALSQTRGCAGALGIVYLVTKPSDLDVQVSQGITVLVMDFCIQTLAWSLWHEVHLLHLLLFTSL